MTGHIDPYVQGMADGWRVLDAGLRALPASIDCDVVIVGTGAGGGTTAEILAKAGLSVVMIEEGPLRSTRDFRMRESEAYPQLYQDSAALRTRDKSISILQGRCVGGSTTVNWSSCFRTPAATLAFWKTRGSLDECTPQALAPWFAQAERRLGIGPWLQAPNENNDLLRRGTQALGLPCAAILRNVRGCANLGYCGMGCPTGAKQSMLVTAIPAALAMGATLLTRARASLLVFEGGTQGRRVAGVEVAWLDATGIQPSGRRTIVRAGHVVLAGGAINTPALLLRSQAPDPMSLAGQRTFLHPTLISGAVLDQRVEPYSGAPQTIYSDHYLDRDPIDGPMGFKLETAPMHPVLSASTLTGFGREHRLRMSALAHSHALLALMRDGFHPESEGGRVRLRPDGSAELDYPLNAFFFSAARRALLAMAEIQFAAGASEVSPVHEHAGRYRRWSEARDAIAALPMEPLLTRVVSAHVMGGCPMSADPARGLVDAHGRHHHIDNLSVHDGSIFPTSVGANPQLSIYGFVARMSATLATKLTGRPAPVWA